MRCLPLPTVTAMKAVDACSKSILNSELSAALVEASPKIQANEAQYLELGPQALLHTIALSQSIGKLSVDEMKRVYRDTFVKSVATRPMYDTIKSAPANDICPLCSQRTVSSLDHYLPQSKHAALTIVPANLVPACAECNKAKLHAQPTSEAEQTFHPYFDNCDDGTWLRATLVQTSPPSLVFHIASPQGWSQAKIDRVRHHFAIFKLGPLYSSHAGEELTNLRFSFDILLASSGPDAVKSFLANLAEGARSANANGWKTAMYEALVSEHWFWNGGFAA